MTLLIHPAETNCYLTATVIDRGPEGYEWIKAQLTNGEECFVYPDTEKTVSVKDLSPGIQLNIQSLRECRTPGATKWTTNALHVNLQTESIKEFIRDSVVDSLKRQPTTFSSTKIRKDKPSVSVPYSQARYEFIQKVIDQKRFDGKYARSQAVAYIVDTCMAQWGF